MDIGGFVPKVKGQRGPMGARCCLPRTALASHVQYNDPMKTSTIPPVRIDPLFRQEIELSLESGESLASLVETAVRNEVARRRAQSEFVRRGMAAIERTALAGDGVAASVVMSRLESKLAAARSRTTA